ncbi:MAG: tRNA uridine-5-carboxymethylaminomethyl(34) synthesis GTPase MnmE [Cephaloticoccus sp.]|nr:tRNA uridine-5-carboxymethylaminomethyl(34) synthesis GTPase MnmE [Cephaloticoccus sp.]MCF7761369.1 tRNA uridine-5-carboxymethylaminomethyl(34) synthesis GTPase MnmE [Cephaloticoccus sp.]
MASPQDTIAALATPNGTSAIAVLRICGPDTSRIARAIAQNLTSPRTAHRTDYHDRNGRLVDDVLLTYFPGPASYTGEDTLEISSHGNPYIAQRILEDLLARGCRLATAGEFTQRAFLNGRMDLSQAEAVMDLIHARSERALAVANQQLRGSLGRIMQELVDGLLNALAQIEAYIDFPDEDLPPEDLKQVGTNIEILINITNNLLATNHYGNILRDGLKTVILGEPNVGKSSLLNRLVGRNRALVSDQPGTTRDYLEEPILLGDHCLRLIDTAGLNPNPAELERLGIEKSLERLNEADLVLLILDSTKPTPVLPVSVVQHLNPKNTLIVRNKCDLPLDIKLPAVWADYHAVSTSALTGSGLEELRAELQQRAESFHVELGDDLIAINARHADSLIQAKDDLARAKAKLLQSEPIEFIASDLRDALAAYGEISGKIDNEQMLDRLFASFCIGK